MKKKSDKSLQISVWLMPKKSSTGSLSMSMKNLAQKFNAPQFVAHVTLYSTSIPAKKFNIIENSLKEIAINFNPLTLNVLSAELSKTLFKSLFLQLESPEELNILYKKVAPVFNEYGEYKLNPHLSLLYKEGLTEEEKTKSIENISLPSQITFNKLAIKISGENDNFGKDINKWTYSILN